MAPGRLSATSRPVSAGPAGLLLARLLEAAGVKRKGGKEQGHFLKAISDHIECELVGSESRVQSWKLGGSQPQQGPLSGVGLLEEVVGAQGFVREGAPDQVTLHLPFHLFFLPLVSPPAPFHLSFLPQTFRDRGRPCAGC